MTKKLISSAMAARKNSYSPYSGYQVGAALLTKSGKIYTGCNIESASYSPTNCAERTAFFSAVSSGERDFSAIAIVGAPKNMDLEKELLKYAFPCGVCRQVMKEFCDGDTFLVIAAKNEEDYLEFTLNDLLPYAFGPENL